VLETFKRRVAALELVPSGGGVFEVSVDGSLVFSKRALGRFPEEDEILRALEAAGSRPGLARD
jgi:selenoprotein W-related protein